MVRRIIGTTAFSFLCGLCVAGQINGTINIEAEWRPVVYLSQIQSFDHLNTASFHFLIAETEIDEQGYFQFDSLVLPVDDHLYRLHICKKNDPVSTIIIGGQEQNHLHFLMNQASNLKIDIRSFYDYDIIGHNGNSTLKQLFDLKKDLNAPLDLPSEQNRSSHRNRILDRYVAIVDSSSSSLNRLFAAYLIEESFGSKEHIDLFERMDQTLSERADSSPYYQDFQSQLQFAKFNSQSKVEPLASNRLFQLITGSIILVAILLFMLYRRRKTNHHTLELLSIQEKKVFELLQAGKSNKEISTELHIEVSTVKSHVYKIFSKLGIKSRKQIIS